MNLGSIPLFQRLDASGSILLAGAGGGFDVYAGVPLYFALRARGKAVHLANLSFSRLDLCTSRRPSPTVVEVAPDSDGPTGYFPEKHLARYLATAGERGRVFAFEKSGVVPLLESYRALQGELNLDAVVLVDGGTDSLLVGDEAGLGTPCEDMASIAAVDALDVPTKLLVSVGFGVDTFHGVSHAHVLESVAALAKSGGYLGAFSLLKEMDEFAHYKAAVEFAHGERHQTPSIVNASIVSAAEGDYGDVHRTDRTRGSALYINPLMALYFAFELRAVAARIGYLGRLRATQTMFEISAVIDAWQREVDSLRPWVTLPM